ncbi:chaperone NapD [Bacillus dakarensis]|uniref:chaperone NapD n=1 Tax=Robertmurraya dakarensis TaxID=1926278 RepID=UPI0009823167|nr:chaperone NapD [Bacillus dakarensis]
MVISGIYIETIPGQALAAANELVKKEGVEVHHIEDDLKIILTLEAESVDRSYKVADTFKEVDGVLTICLVYSNFEDDPLCKEADGWQ